MDERRLVLADVMTDCLQSLWVANASGRVMIHAQETKRQLAVLLRSHGQAVTIIGRIMMLADRCRRPERSSWYLEHTFVRLIASIREVREDVRRSIGWLSPGTSEVQRAVVAAFDTTLGTLEPHLREPPALEDFEP